MNRSLSYFSASCLILVASLTGWQASCGFRQDGTSVLLITIDTVRADHVGCYGFSTAETPALDSLAERGILFEQAHSHVPLTFPSHANILTGNLPSSLNLRVNGLVMDPQTLTLAEILEENGFWTGAVVASTTLAGSSGLDQGFTRFDDRMNRRKENRDPPLERDAGNVTDAALEMLKEAGKPYFLWVHYYDPHADYLPPEPYRSRYRENPYDGEIAYMDSQIGRLLRGLEEMGRRSDTLIVLAGDHGEGLGEHGEREHGVFLYEYALRVPMMMAWDHRLESGRKIASLCGLTDIAPTILDLLGIRSPDMDGVTLVPLINRSESGKRELYIESYHGTFDYGWSSLRGIMNEEWKFIQAPRPELYRWKDSETENLYGQTHEMVRTSMRALKNYPTLDEKELEEMDRLKTDPDKADLRKQLQSLGYLTPGSGKTAENRNLDPKDMIWVESELYRIADMTEAGQITESITALNKILETNPDNTYVLSVLGQIYMYSGRYAEAIPYFEEGARNKPFSLAHHLTLAALYLKTGKPDKAAAEFEISRGLAPGEAQIAADLTGVYLDLDMRKKARTILEEALESGVEHASLYSRLGRLEWMEQNPEASYEALSKAASMKSSEAETYYYLARVARKLNKPGRISEHLNKALKFAPDDPVFLAKLGDLMIEENEKERALICFQRALALDKVSQNASRYREMVKKLSRLNSTS